MMASALTSAEISDSLMELPDWRFSADALERTFTFDNFSEALAFIVRLGIEAERLNHHPHLTNVWNRVTLRLNTHDAGNRVTPLDVDLARAISALT